MASQENIIEGTVRSPRGDPARERGGRKVDWEAVREHWIVMNLDPTRSPSREFTLAQVARDFGVTHSWTRTKAAEGGWRDELRARRRAVADAAIERAQETAIAVEAEIRDTQIKIARGLYTLLGPVIKGYQRRVSEDPHGELNVSVPVIRLFVSAMKEAREAAGFGARPDAAAQDNEIAERIARHRETGGLLADILDEIAAAAEDEAPTDETPA